MNFFEKLFILLFLNFILFIIFNIFFSNYLEIILLSLIFRLIGKNPVDNKRFV